jgi:hypothetical protein
MQIGDEELNFTDEGSPGDWRRHRARRQNHALTATPISILEEMYQGFFKETKSRVV